MSPKQVWCCGVRVKRQQMYAAGVNCLHWGRPILYGNPHARLVLPRKV